MLRYLFASFAVAAELLAAYPALADDTDGASAPAAAACSITPADATNHPATQPIAPGEGWG